MRSGHPAGWEKIFRFKRVLTPGTVRLRLMPPELSA